jgi:hypothetical protein
MATASFCLGLWGDLVFWWYPFGICIATMGLIFGLISLGLGIRAGRDGENLALGGVLLSLNAIIMALIVYRGMQFFFEGTLPSVP